MKKIILFFITFLFFGFSQTFSYDSWMYTWTWFYNWDNFSVEVTSTNIHIYKNWTLDYTLPNSTYYSLSILNSDFLWISHVDSWSRAWKYSIIARNWNEYFFLSQENNFLRFQNSNDVNLYLTSDSQSLYNWNYCINTSWGWRSVYNPTSSLYFASTPCNWWDTWEDITWKIIFENTILSLDTANLSCQTHLVNYPYPQWINPQNFTNVSWENASYLSIIDSWTRYNFSFQNIRAETGQLQSVISQTGSTYEFKKSLFWKDPLLQIETDGTKKIDYLEIHWTWSIDYYRMTDCSWNYISNPTKTGTDFESWKFDFSTRYDLTQAQKFCVEFPMSIFNSFTISQLNIWQKANQIQETLYCVNEDTWDTSVWFDENNLQSFSWSVQDLQNSWDTSVKLYNENIYDPSLWDIIKTQLTINNWEVISPNWNIWDACDMFNSSWDFVYASWTTFVLNLSLNNTWLPSALISMWNFVLKPVNSLLNTALTAWSVFTPITSSTEWKKFCLLGVVVEYQARPILATSDLRYKMFFIDYIFLLIYYYALFKLFYYIRHNTLIHMQ